MEGTGGGSRQAQEDDDDIDYAERDEEVEEEMEEAGGEGNDNDKDNRSCGGDRQCQFLPRTSVGRPAAKIFVATSLVECAKHPRKFLRSKTHWVRECKFCSCMLSGVIRTTQTHVIKDCSKITSDERQRMLKYVERGTHVQDAGDVRTKVRIQQSIEGYLGMSMSKINQSAWYYDLAKAAIKKNLPFDIYEDEDVQKGYLRFNSRLVFPSRKVIAKRIRDIDEDVQSSIMDALGKETNLTLSLDGWTNIRGESLWAFTVLTPSRRSYLVEVKDLSAIKHTGFNLQAEIKAVMDKWGGPHRFIAVVTDNVSNCKSAREGLQKQLWEGEDDEGEVLKIWVLALRCMPHAFNLIVGDFLKHQWAATRIQLCKKLFNHFSRSSMLNAALIKERNLLAGENGKSVRGLSLSVCTRWLSHHSMFESVAANIKPIARVFIEHMDDKSRSLRDSTVQDPDFASDIQLLENLLLPFTIAMATVEGRSGTLASVSVHLFVLGRALVKRYNESAKTTSNLSSFSKLDFLYHCCSRFLIRLKEFKGDLLSLSILLDPTLRFVQSYSNSEETFQSLRESALELYSKKISNLATPTAVAISAAIKDFVANRTPWNRPYKLGDRVSDWFDAIPDTVGTIGLKAIAGMLLAIVPNQADTERTFSILGYVHSKSRNRLGTAMATSLVRCRLFFSSPLEQRGSNSLNAAPMDVQAPEIDVQAPEIEVVNVGETEPEILDAIFEEWDDIDVNASLVYNDDQTLDEIISASGFGASQEIGVMRKKRSVNSGDNNETREVFPSIMQQCIVVDKLWFELNAMFDFDAAVPGDPLFQMPGVTTLIDTTQYEQINVKALVV